MSYLLLKRNILSCTVTIFTNRFEEFHLYTPSNNERDFHKRPNICPEQFPLDDEHGHVVSGTGSSSCWKCIVGSRGRHKSRVKDLGDKTSPLCRGTKAFAEGPQGGKVISGRPPGVGAKYWVSMRESGKRIFAANCHGRS